MAVQVQHPPKVNTAHFHVLARVPPFVDILIQCYPISPAEFSKVARLAASYPNDPRLIEMVRKAGDASAKVPYLMDYGETAQSILDALREVARPHVEYLRTLPEGLQATIHTLLSIHMVPRGCESFAIAALLEIERIQQEMIHTLRAMMAGRKLAEEFHNENQAALAQLDRDWPNLRKGSVPWPFPQSLPDRPQMQYIPTFFNNTLAAMREVCVIVDAPCAHELKRLTPPVLQYPLPLDEPVPAIGSADWLIRVVGKVGRHFTRALLQIISTHLKSNLTAAEMRNYELINQQAQEALRAFIERTP